MTSYQYIARTSAGEEVTGVMQADSESAIAHALDERGLFPVRITVQAEVRRRGGGRIRLRDMAVLYGQLSDLLRSGVPLMRSMEVLARSSANRRLAGVISAVHSQVSEGKSLSEAMSEHPQIFTPLHAAMIRAGERGGFLEDVLTSLGEYLDRADDLRSRIRGAMIYPIMLVGVGVVVILVILLAVVPLFRETLSNMPLPLPTQVLFGLSEFLSTQWATAVGALVLTILGVSLAVRSAAGRRLWDSWQLRLPVVGPLVRGLNIARFCRILGTMLHSGVPILQALSISKDAAGSMRLQESIQVATENVRAGNKLAAPLAAGGIFPPDVIEMIAVAEESNQMEKVLVQIAANTERHVSRQVDTLVRLIEPLILVLIAGVIAFVAVGLLYPIFTMSRTLKFR